MAHKVYIHKIIITRGGEKNHFQIKLPKDAKRIVGIEITNSIPVISQSLGA